MQWLGFGKGFVFNEVYISNAWSDMARKASLAARRASKKAHKATDGTEGKTLYPTYANSNLALKSAEAAVKSEHNGDRTSTGEHHTNAVQLHIKAAEWHNLRASGVEQDGFQEKAADHIQAAKLHDKAAKAHTNAGLAHADVDEVDWRPTETIPEDYDTR